MERKISKEYSGVFLIIVILVGGKKFKLRNLPSRNSSLLSVCELGWHKSLYSTTLEFEAEVVHSFFFCRQPSYFAVVRTHFSRKNTSMYMSTAYCHGKRNKE